jgi:hypothetical protein
METLALFVRLLLTITPPLPDAQAALQAKGQSGTRGSSKPWDGGSRRGRVF